MSESNEREPSSSDEAEGGEKRPAKAEPTAAQDEGARAKVERFLEVDAASKAAGLSADKERALGHALVCLEAADRIRLPSEPLRGGSGAGAALSLLREATAWAASALGGEGAPFDVVAAAAKGVGEETIALAKKGHDKSFRDSGADPADTRAIEADALARVIAAAIAPLEQRVDRARWRPYRTLLKALSMLAALALVLNVLGRGVSAAATPRDLAEGKPWKASSAYRGLDVASHVCDGRKTMIAFHTNNDDKPWYEVDLGAPTTISRVDVRNRTDGFQARAVPLVVEVSTDHGTFDEVARKTEGFDEWKASFAPRQARWVRVRADRKTFLHLEKVAVR